MKGDHREFLAIGGLVNVEFNRHCGGLEGLAGSGVGNKWLDFG